MFNSITLLSHTFCFPPPLPPPCVNCLFSVCFQIRLFCNTFRSYPSNRLDAVSLRLVIANFVLDPFTYVLFKRSFKRNLRRSITELTVFLGDVRLSRKLKRQTKSMKQKWATLSGLASDILRIHQ